VAVVRGSWWCRGFGYEEVMIGTTMILMVWLLCRDGGCGCYGDESVEGVLVRVVTVMLLSGVATTAKMVAVVVGEWLSEISPEKMEAPKSVYRCLNLMLLLFLRSTMTSTDAHSENSAIIDKQLINTMTTPTTINNMATTLRSTSSDRLRSSTKELLTPLENPEQKFCSKRILFDTLSLMELNSPEFDQISYTKEQSEEDELRDNTFSGSEHEDANEHIEKVLKIVDLFHILKITQDQIMLRAFPVSLTGAASKWIRNQPSEEINNFQQEPDESIFCAWERFKELLMKYPQHYLTDMQEVILFYNELDVPTQQILDSKGAIPSKTDADAKVAIQEMAEFSQKWHNETSSRSRSTKTSDELTSI
nr:hypothetical protein [Tanacetum cinerariifolium]